MGSNALPVSRLVKVDVNLTPAAAQIQNLSTMMILGSSDVIDTYERARPYDSIEQVVADFGSSAPEYLAALLWFQQAPQPTTLMIGRWAQAATHGRLLGGIVSATNQLIATWNAITAGSLKVTVDGALQTITGLNFSAATNLNGVASILQAAITGTTVVWNANYQRFEIRSNTTSTTSSVSFMTAHTTGTDITGMLAMLSTSSGAYVVQGMAPETALEAVVIMDEQFSGKWYAITVIGAADDDHLEIAPYIEATNVKHIYGISTMEAGVLSAVSTTDIAYIMAQFNYKKTVLQYSSSTPYAVCSLLSRILTVDYTGNNTVITLMYKQEPGIVAESIGPAQVTALEDKNCNVFVNYNNDTAIIQNGVMSSGDFMDIITGTDWLSLDIQTAVFNLLYTSTTKIPQTDRGMNLILATVENECSRAVTNGLLAPGVWNAGGFGSLNQGDYLAKGFYCYAPPMSQQNQSDRAARKAPTVQVACKLAGAIHTANVILNVNQ